MGSNKAMLFPFIALSAKVATKQGIIYQVGYYEVFITCGAGFARFFAHYNFPFEKLKIRI